MRALLLLSLLLPIACAPANAAERIRVLVLHWYDRSYPGNQVFDTTLQAALAASGAEVEYYPEYLETNRFPGEHQAELLSEYLQRKYARHTIDVLISGASPTLEFLLKFRGQLFPHVPIVFATERPVDAAEMAKVGAAGFVFGNTFARTLGLALQLHPHTKQLYVVSGTLEHDQVLEAMVRDELRGFERRVAITYLTDFPPEELAARIAALPKDSLILYVWQQVLDAHGRLLETQDVLARVAAAAKTPIYGKSHAMVGRGIVGGYVWTLEGDAAKLAEIALRIIHGARPQDIPIDKAPETPMFDWRQLERWGIPESRLPPGSVVLFREATMWQRYQSRIVAVAAIFAAQAFLIGALLVGRRRARRAQQEVEKYRDHLKTLVEERTAELVETRDQATAARDLAEAASKAKSAFLANMSHELRTPLNAILGFSAVVRAEADLSEKHRQDLMIVGRSGENLLRLIDGVLDMAKIESGGFSVADDVFDFRRLLDETATLLRERAQRKNLGLFLDVSPEMPQFIRLDHAKLRQVLINLVSNAVEYTDAGEVRVRAAVRRDASSPVALLVEVEDSGVGIAEEDRARIFEPFVQVGARSRKGTGLGLSITRHFVQLMGGRIEVESEVGRGSRFQVELPAAVAEACEATVETAAGEELFRLEAGQPEQRILIVEDKRENWLLLQRLLEAAGFRTRVAQDGVEAAAAFEAWRPHFIWMDVLLPVLSGLEAARRIRQLDGGRETKIVAVTASAFASERERVLAAGMDDFLRKPFRPTEVFDCLARHLGVRYAAATRSGGAVDDVARLRAEDLDELPELLRERLRQAILSLNENQIAGAIRDISAQNEPLGRTLGQFAARLAYSSILQALGAEKARQRV